MLEKYGSDPPLRFPPYTPFKLAAMSVGFKCNRPINPGACCYWLFVLCFLAAFGVLIWRASLAA